MLINFVKRYLAQEKHFPASTQSIYILCVCRIASATLNVTLPQKSPITSKLKGILKVM
jgi:hypothetical protein